MSSQRSCMRLDSDDVSATLADQLEGEEGWEPIYDCGDRCDFCVPDWRDRDEALRELSRQIPAFMLADRVLAQAGLAVRQFTARPRGLSGAR